MSKHIPKFKNEDEEREFWAAHNSSDYINWSNAEGITFLILNRHLKNILTLSRLHRRREMLALKKMCDTVFMLLLVGARKRSEG